MFEDALEAGELAQFLAQVARLRGEGADALLVTGDELLNDTRCASCGSFLFSVVRDGAYVHVGMGSLIDAPTIRPEAHIFVGSKAEWHEITDELPQFHEYAG